MLLVDEVIFLLLQYLFDLFCSYMMIAPTIQQARCKAWIERHLTPGGRVSVSDVTSMFTAICIMGPFTRILLSELTDTDLSPKGFPFFTCKVFKSMKCQLVIWWDIKAFF